MSYFAVIREAGCGWTERGIAAQPRIADHAAFMSDLADERFVLLRRAARRNRDRVSTRAADQRRRRAPSLESDRRMAAALRAHELSVSPSEPTQSSPRPSLPAPVTIGRGAKQSRRW